MKTSQDSSLWPTHRHPHPSQTEDPSASPTHASHHHPSSHNQHGHHSHRSASRTLLAQLQTEENNIEVRKSSIRRYGASWIRPPGVAKTYQALIDEEHEREEQEILARREQVMLDLQAAQQEAQNAEAREANGDEMEDGEGEVDLDDEVPEAEADESDVSVSEEEESGSEAEEGDTRQDVTFNEDSFIEGSMLEGQVSHMLAREAASMEGILQEEHDLDDDIPEAGEYEHTDSSLIDSSDDDTTNMGSFVAPPPLNRRREARRSSGATNSGPVLMQQSNRRSVELEGSSSIMEGSSFMRSSPAAARGSLRARFMGARGGRAC